MRFKVLSPGLLALRKRSPPPPRSLAPLLVAVLLASGLAAVAHHTGGQRPGGEDPMSALLPARVKQYGYVSSDACRACHPSQYASWHKTYHRSMTQVVTPDTLLARWEGTLLWRDKTYHLERQDDQYWVDMVDPEWHRERLFEKKVAGPNRTRRVRNRVAMSTGSHHQQAYWIASGNGREQILFPFTWLLPEGRWYPYELSFLRPDPPEEMADVWNETCVKCHATGAQPWIDLATQVPYTRTAELGIACEACHGPGADHLQANQDPARRYRLHLSGQGDPTIVQPERLPAERSAQVCGQCHAVTRPKTRALTREWAQVGYRYRPGDDLLTTRWILRRPDDLDQRSPSQRAYYDSFTWSDGKIRVSGRDYNAFLESPCFRGGTLSCSSCHSMHDSEPDDQLRRDRTGDDACLQCHGQLRDRIAEHSHHPAGSSGSRCYNCHMPFTTYGLFKAIRGHTIGLSPSVDESVRVRRPNACNLCHLDKSLGWTGRTLERWYGRAHVEIPGEDGRERSAALLWLLQGDAGLRALVAWNMGHAPAVQASAGAEWLAPFLVGMLDDPYAAVRLISHRSLRKLPGFEDFAYDFAGPRGERRRAVERGLERWSARSHRLSAALGDSLLLDPDGGVEAAAVARILAARDHRHIDLAE